jgi:subtilisin family serine protease
MDSLKEKMGQAWAKKLFVVAAGNNFKEVKNMRERVAISWAGELPNLIGVGATDDNGNLLAPWAPDPTRPDEKIPGSNWGKQHVHLLAPGKQILSTASENKYACASGTSMAVPQVTAAAATLSDQGLGDPTWIKARLIYTADWGPQLINKVWGGQLNYGRAVRQHNLNLLVTQDNPDPDNFSLLEFDGNPKIEVIDGDVDDPRGDQVDRPRKIAFKDILRIQRLSEPYAGRFRVIYLEGSDSKRLRIINRALISGQVNCRQQRKWKKDVNAFDTTNNCPANRHLDVSSIFYDYVARIPGGYANISLVF